MLKTNLFGTIQDQMNFKLDSVKADAYVHQQGFEETLEKKDLKAAITQCAETIIHYSQCCAILDTIDIVFGLDESQKVELRDNLGVIERNLERLEALRRELSQPVKV